MLLVDGHTVNGHSFPHQVTFPLKNPPITAVGGRYCKAEVELVNFYRKYETKTYLFRQQFPLGHVKGILGDASVLRRVFFPRATLANLRRFAQ